MTIILYGSHDGELDRQPVDPERDEGIQEAIRRLLDRCVIYPGDRITIEDK
jgi:hypothetical protein